MGVLKSAGVLVYNIVVGQWGVVTIRDVVRLLSAPSTVILLISAFAVSALLAMYVDRTRSRTFSRFWHTSRQELRAALKQSKAAAARKEAAIGAASGGQ